MTHTKKSLFHSNDTELFFALPFSQSQNSITEVSNDFVCLFVLRLNVPVNNFFYHVRKKPLLPLYYQYFLGVKFLAQGHNTEVGFEPRPLAPESDALPLSHHAPPVSIEYSHHNYHKISKVYFELNTRAIGWSAEECASISLCVRGYTENRPAGCLQSVIQNTPITIAWDWLTVSLTDRLNELTNK